MGVGKEVYAFPKGISPKVNVTAKLEPEVAYSDVAVQHVNHYTTRSLLQETNGCSLVSNSGQSILLVCIDKAKEDLL